MPNINKRIYTGTALAGGLVLMLFYAPVVVNCAVLCLIAAIAMLEFYAIIRQVGVPVFRNIGVAGGLLLIVATCAALVLRPGAHQAEVELAVLFALFVAVCIRQFPQRLNVQPVATIACTIFGVLYIAFLFNFFVKLGLSWDSSGWLDRVGITGSLLCFYLIAVVKATDIGAYLVGCRFGKHKLFPRLSPAKTWEGFAGGLAFGMAFSLGLYAACGGHFGAKLMRWQDAVILGLVLPLLGMAGDLVESLLKRAGGSKDAGGYIPGMGGVMDVLDSLLIAVPFFYFYVLWLLPTSP